MKDSDLLINELGCGNCHAGIDNSTLIPLRAPDLSNSGSKYNPAFIFDYLKSPKGIRKNIGKSRMPNFNFSNAEALALTKYLDSKKIENMNPPRYQNDKNLDAVQLISNDYQCTSCHVLNAEGQEKSINLNLTGARLKKEWIYDTIYYPQKHISTGTAMPQFFDVNDNSSKKIVTSMTNYLLALSKSNLKNLNKKLKKAQKQFPEITAEEGRKIFQSQNCMSCHTMEGEITWFAEHNAPNIAIQKMRTKDSWLYTYLKEPHPIRPNGYYPGTGSRMPNYNLSQDEVDKILNWFKTYALKTSLQPISNFQIDKVENLLNDNLSCLGCHQLNGKGGIVGPDLTNVGTRLTDGYIKMSIEKPHMVLPESIMPQQNIDKKITKLLQSYLAMQKNPSSSKYIDLIKNKPYQINNNYISNCAACHGLKGAGNGFNAAYLPVEPGNLTDAEKMAQRSDDTLYETLYNGGRIMKKHHFMPGWGLKLSHKEIVELVEQIRQFCDCASPKWAEK